MDDDDHEAVARYMRFIGFERDQIETSTVAWAIIEPNMATLVDRFYDHLFAIGLQSKFGGKDLTALKRNQLSYWQTLFTGDFDANYRTHVGYIAEKHRAANVDLTDYIGSYAWFSQRFHMIIEDSAPPKPFR